MRNKRLYIMYAVALFGSEIRKSAFALRDAVQALSLAYGFQVSDRIGRTRLREQRLVRVLGNRRYAATDPGETQYRCDANSHVDRDERAARDAGTRCDSHFTRGVCEAAPRRDRKMGEGGKSDRSKTGVARSPL